MMATAATRSSLPACDQAGRRRATLIATALAVATLLTGASGCSVCQHMRRTVFKEPSEFSWRKDRGRSLKVYRQWADEAWALEMGGCPEGVGADDYALGFRDGFVDYIYAGGTGEPPPVPPRQFWNVGWRTPAGSAGAEQWFAGYRHGAQSARNTGFRQNGVVRSSYAGDGGPWIDGGQPVAGTPEDVGPPAETLPVPSDASEPDTSAYDDQMLPEPPAPPTPPTDESMLPQEEAPLDAAPLDSEPEGAMLPPPVDAPPSDELFEPATTDQSTLRALPPAQLAEFTQPEAPAQAPSVPTASPAIPASQQTPAAPAVSATQRFRRAVRTARTNETSNPQ